MAALLEQGTTCNGVDPLTIEGNKVVSTLLVCDCVTDQQGI